MKNKLKKILLLAAGFFAISGVFAQNVSLNMLVLNSGVVPLGGNENLRTTINASAGTSGQSTPIPIGKINISITVPPSLLISPTQTNIPDGWSVRNNNGIVINICNSSTTVAVNTAIDLLINLEGVTVTSGAPTMSGQLSFKTNCSAPGALSGDNPSDNSGQAGFSVANTVPLTLTNFNASLINCQPALNWTTETEVNSDRFEIERANQNSSNWRTIRVIASTGNGSSKNKYSFSDNNSTPSSEKLLYRLKMIDRNGSFKYSEVLSVFINCKTTEVYAYPNPVQTGKLYFGVTNSIGYAEAILMSQSGELLLKTKMNSGINYLPVSNIANGLYILNIKDTNGFDKKVKVFIQN